jgi:transposase
MGGLRPDYRTITRFRRKHEKALKKVLKYSAQMCIDLELVDGNMLFVDGTKIKANASLNNKWMQPDVNVCSKLLKRESKIYWKNANE